MSDGSSTSIGTIVVALTTVFTPPNWCTTQLYTYQTKIGGLSQFIRDASGPGDGRTSSCYPPNFGVFKTGISYGIYSPAICPSGWHPTTIDHSLLSPTVSWSMCCPTGFRASLYDGAGWSCQSTVTTPTTVAMDQNTYIRVTKDILVADWPIFIAWESSDLDIFTPASAPLLTGASPSRPKQTMPTATQHSNAGSMQGLSSGTEIGLGVGVGVGAIALIVVIVLCLMKRKKRQHAMAEQNAHYRSSGYPGELASDPKSPAWVYETAASPVRAELPTSWQGHEM